MNRMTEHKYAVKTGGPKNGIAVHVQRPQHFIDNTPLTVGEMAAKAQ